MDFASRSKSSIRSMGFKLITVGILAVLMTIPALLVQLLVEDRLSRAAEVSKSIGEMSGGPQTFLGPILAVPYSLPDSTGKTRVDQGVYIIFPARGNADVVTRSEVRQRSLFKATVYTATIDFKALFDLSSSLENLPQQAELNWGRAEFIAGASDSRGALADVTIGSAASVKAMGLSTLLPRLTLSVPQHPEAGLKFFAVPAGTSVGQQSKFEITATMKFSGSQKLAILPFGRSSEITVRGDWPHPGFAGGFLPTSRSTQPAGFQAHWSVPFIARGVEAGGTTETLNTLFPLAPSVTFVELADSYQSVTRSLKYSLLFFCLVFSTFFVFETTTHMRVHPAQYFLVGVAQLIFYLLLLSISERTGFSSAFAIASLATVSLISINAFWIFKSRQQGLRAFAVFSLIYALIYVLLTLEDQALLIGAITSFVAIAVIMYFTRFIDWYGPGDQKENSPGEAQTVASSQP